MTKEKKKEAPEKKYYDVRLEVMAPITFTFRVLAESPEEALETCDKFPPTTISKPNVKRSRKINAAVYDAGTTIIHHTRKY